MFDYTGATTCLPVSTIYVMDVTDANANAIWYPGNEENAWEYALSTSDSMTAAELEAAALPVTTNNVALSGLVRDTNYTFYIRPVCSASEKGFWSHQTFTTPHVDYYYDVTVTVNDDEMGEVEGLTHVLEGTDTILVAEANLGYHFVNWTMGATVLGTNDTLEVTVDSNMAIMANFASDTFHVTFAVNDATGLKAALEEIDSLEKTPLDRTVYQRWQEYFAPFLLGGVVLLLLAVSLQMSASRRLA
jgi:hypothetical protein